jgi:hypothetical protein
MDKLSDLVRLVNYLDGNLPPDTPLYLSKITDDNLLVLAEETPLEEDGAIYIFVESPSEKEIGP